MVDYGRDQNGSALRGAWGKFVGLGPIFLCTVAIPTAAAILYFGLIASDVYTSEARFVVRSPNKQAESGLTSLLRTAGTHSAGDEVYAVQDYARSRDALKALDGKGMVSNAYGRPEIDMFNRFGGPGSDGSFEELFKYFRRKVEIEPDPATSVTTLTVKAYTARDAFEINRHLLELSEGLVNRLNTRAQADLIKYAQAELEDARRRASETAVALAAYRNQQGILDPEKQATVQLQMISKLQDELISTKTQLIELQSVAPGNPQVSVLKVRVSGLSKEIDEQLGAVAGGRASLAAAAVNYQKLALESDLAEKQVASALASLETARNDARRQQVYVERIVQPNLPDKALEPKRLRGIFGTFVFGMILWGILSLLLAALREHKD